MASTSRAAEEEDCDLVLASGSETAINLVEFKPHARRHSDAASDAGSDKDLADVTTALIGSSGPALGAPEVRQRFWWSRVKASDPDAIATQPSVYDDVDLAEQYRPNADWENIHRFDPEARWTWAEERKIVRKIDLRIMVWACVMFCALEMDRANIRQAVTDNLLEELGMTTNDYNLGNSIFAFSFLCAEVPSQLVSKWVGPDRWIPTQMVLWSIVASSQYQIASRTSFLVYRSLLGLLQGGFIPDVVLYLSYFYKHHELTVRLGFFWAAIVIADVVAALSAYALIHLRGILGLSGWRWLFLVEGLVTMCLGLTSFGMMPAGPTQTSGWLRGKKGWFTPREETIIVNRVIRDDPSKGNMHNREAISFGLLWKSLMDYDLWPIYILGLTNHIPFATPNIYLTLSLKDLGFSTFQTNLLVVPSQLLHVTNMVVLTYLGEIFGQLAFVAAIPQVWALPFLVWLRSVDTSTISKWTVWGVMTVFLGNPYSHPIQVGWASRNANTVRSRTVGAAMYNMCVQAGGIIAANVYREDDAPRYTRGNSVLIGIALLNIGLYALTKLYYTARNRYRERTWNRMTEDDKLDYLAKTRDAGNKRLDFRFAS